MISWDEVSEAAYSADAKELRILLGAMVAEMRDALRYQTGQSVLRNGAESCIACYPYSDQYLPIPCPNCWEEKVCGYCAQCDKCGKEFC